MRLPAQPLFSEALPSTSRKDTNAICTAAPKTSFHDPASLNLQITYTTDNSAHRAPPAVPYAPQNEIAALPETMSSQRAQNPCLLEASTVAAAPT